MENNEQIAQTADIRRSRGVSIIWTLPLLALFICGWLLYESVQNAGIEITIYFDDARGITASKTQVMAKGIPVGLVKSLEPDMKNNRVRAIVEMDKGLADALVEETDFWIVKPEISATSIRGLETIISGSYIAIRAGKKGEKQRVFNALAEPPAVSLDAPGLHLTLTASELGSIQKETGVYYKNIKIGSVQRYELAKDNSILIHIHILPKFSGLVREGSRFYNASGLSVTGNLPDLSIQIESLASLLRGGILMYTPKELANTQEAENGFSYALYNSLEEASFGIPMTLQLASGEDIIEGKTKLMYRGLEAGFVKEITINDDERRSVTAQILLDPRASLILKENTVFWLVKPTVTAAGVDNLRTLITGSHITFRPGDGEFTSHFTILPEPPPPESLRPGTTLTLRSSHGIELERGSTVFFKDLQIGEVMNIDFADGSADIETTILIYEQYKRFVAGDSIFWVETGMKVQADLTGIDLQTGPLTRMLSGGVVLTTPSLDTSTPVPYEAERIFPLFPNRETAISQNRSLQPSGIQFQLKADSTLGLVTGAPLYFQQLKIGHISGLDLEGDTSAVLLGCFVEERYRHLLNGSTKFYALSGLSISGGLNDINIQLNPLESVMRGGVGIVTPETTPTELTHGPHRLYDSFDQAIHANDPEISVTFATIGDLGEGAPVRYKGVEVGQVTDIRFGEDTETVKVRFRVDELVLPLFRTTTRIWQVHPRISLSGVSDLGTALFGPYLTFDPGAGKPSRSFAGLDQEPPKTFGEGDGLPLILESTHLGSLSIGSPLYYREMQIGEVTGFELSPSFQQLYIFVLVQPKYSAIIRGNTKFWNISGARVSGGLLTGLTLSTGSVQSIVRGGIALATPNTEDAGQKAEAGQRFTLHDTAQSDWLEWNPDIILLGN